MIEIKTIEQYNEILKKEFVVFIAKTKKCTVCEPVHERIKQLLEKKPLIEGYFGYVDELELLRGQLLIFSVPTIIIFDRGRELLRESRFVDFNRIEGLIDQYLEYTHN